MTHIKSCGSDAGGRAEPGKAAQATKRAQVRLLAELLAAAVSSECSALLTALQPLGCGEGSEGAWSGLSLLAGFCKAGRADLLRLPPRAGAAVDLDAAALQVPPWSPAWSLQRCARICWTCHTVDHLCDLLLLPRLSLTGKSTC